MMSFCNKSIHPILSFPDSNNNGTKLDFSLPHHHQNILTPALFESSALVSPPISTTATAKRDPGGVGFLDEVGGSVDGLMSCTESLGFESSDERTMDDQIEDLEYHSHYNQDLFSRKSYSNNLSSSNSRWQRNNNLEKKEKKFPPPLSSLNQDGKPNFFLRAVRKDGRLELKEVKIGRPETLLASRQDGRLRLHLIRDDQQEDDEEEQEQEDVIEAIDENDHEEITDDEEEEEQEDENVSEWKFPVTRRCYELTSHHVHVPGHGHGHHHHGPSHGHNNHHHDLHVWRQPCVTTR